MQSIQPLIPGMADTFDYDFTGKRVMVSLSGGINSAAVLCYLATEHKPEYRPKEIWLFYSHLREHSPGTGRFVCDQIRYAKRKFDRVTWRIHRASVVKFFENKKFIPHPMLSPCSEHLKMIPAMEFMKEHSIDLDLIGYVREEKRRIKRQLAKGKTDKVYPISHYSNEDCFSLVEREIGWYPEIYKIKEGNRQVFLHNNCLPCKNFQGYLKADGECSEDYQSVKKYYPQYFEKARSIAESIDGYWGREPDFIDGHCKFCEFD